VLRTLLTGVSNDFARYDLVVESASPLTMIPEVVRRLNPDLLILGTHGRGLLGRALFGSVSNRVMSAAVCDVLIVPDGVFSITSQAVRDIAAADPAGSLLQ
jgi:nucleotide-binding universal stress UspA family protein